MKENIKSFFNEKKELFIFIGVVVLVLGTVLGISLLAKGDKSSKVANTNSTTEGTTTSTTTEKVTLPPVVYEKMILPIDGDYEIVRYYFNIDDPETLSKAVMVAANYYAESKGVSYARPDNTAFDCLAVYSGEVIDVTEDAMDGRIVVIQHDNGVVSRYSALSEVSVNIGDYVKSGAKIGVAGNSLSDATAGVHVHLELLKDNVFVNPIISYNKELTELVSDTNNK